MEEVENLLFKYQKSRRKDFLNFEEDTKKIKSICFEIDRSWSQFPFGDCVFYYYKNFLIPPEGASFSIEWGTMNGVPSGWVQLRREEVKNEIEKRAGFTIEQYTSKVESFFKSLKRLKGDISIELERFNTLNPTEKLKNIIQKIEHFDIGDHKQFATDYLNNSAVMGQFVSRDVSSLTKGKRIPSHLTTFAYGFAATELLEREEDFLELVRSAILINKTAIPSSLPNVDLVTRTTKIFDRFHSVARQLLQRHASRNTLNIGDEYDVQDLLHALLLMEFDDVRPEEHTPSYAGSSTRMDFLLKKEQIVIEVKMTSKTLKEKDIGQQLILDIAHYKTHPDCKILYCFIYDPNFCITKKSLINDIEKVHDGLEVKVFISPSR